MTHLTLTSDYDLMSDVCPLVCFVCCSSTGQLVTASSVCWYGHVLRREDAHVMRRATVFEVEGHKEVEILLGTLK